VIQLV